MLLKFPLLIFVVIGYNVLVFTSGIALQDQLFSLNMMSGGVWSFSVADAILCLALVLLFVEILKATRTDSSSIIDHALSTLVFIGCLVEFILVDKAVTSTFFFITLISLIDVVAGYSITIRAARRDFAMGPRGEY